jgi:CheY-like chemotaxis protein
MALPETRLQGFVTPSHRGSHVLVVNHSPEVPDLVRGMLEGMWYRVTTPLRADQDIDTIAAAVPDVIVVCHILPTADDLPVLVHLLTIDRRTRGIPLIVCTGVVPHVQEVSDHLQRTGVRVVDKLFDFAHLRWVMGEVLDERAIDTGGVPSGSE